MQEYDQIMLHQSPFTAEQPPDQPQMLKSSSTKTTSTSKHHQKSLFDTLKSFQKSIKYEHYWQRLYLKQLKEQSE